MVLGAIIAVIRTPFDGSSLAPCDRNRPVTQRPPGFLLAYRADWVCENSWPESSCRTVDFLNKLIVVPSYWNLRQIHGLLGDLSSHPAVQNYNKNTDAYASIVLGLLKVIQAFRWYALS